ncbi:MAG: ComEC/Rec2 family competence protein [Candidatus Humimicrobiaceae bacterium]
MRRLYWIAINNHYILWTISFGLGLLLGIKLFQYSQVSSLLYFFIIGVMLITSLAGPVYILRKNTISDENIPEAKNLLLVVIIPVVVMVLMGYLVGLNSKEDKGVDLSFILENEEYGASGVIIAKGRVSGHPVINYGSLYFEMDAECLWHAVDGEDSMDEYIEDGKIDIIIKRPGELRIKRDNFIEVKGEAEISTNGSWIKAAPGNIRFIGASNFPERLFEFREIVYNCINRTFYKYLSYKYAPIAEALILGNRTNVPDRFQDDFRQSGTAHLMAISGMHISFIVLIIYVIAGRSRSGIIMAVSIVIFLVMYNFMLGLKASVLRASIWMISAVIAAQWNRQINKPRILCISFILLLILNPSFTSDIGFWFSFTAMAGVVFIYPLFIKIISHIPQVKRIANNPIFRMFILTISIQLICGPLILYYFRFLPLISAVSNIFILPFFYMLLLFLLISASFAIIWPPLGGIILRTTTPLFKIITLLTGFFSRPGFPVIKASRMMPLQLSMYYMALIILLIMVQSSLEKKMKVK